MKKFLLLLIVVVGAVFAYFWYIRGVNLLRRTPDNPLPHYGAVTQTPPTAAGTAPAPAVVAYQWKAGAPMPTPRADIATVSIGSHVYVIGGLGDLATPTAAVEMYDTHSDTWTKLRALPNPVRNPAAAAVGGKIYVFGGFKGLAGTPVDTVFIYDPGKDQWTSGASLPHLIGGSAAVVVDGRVHLFGGDTIDGVTDLHLVYDPASNAWSTETAMITARDSAVAVLVGRKIYVIGGQQGSVVYATDIVESYDVDRQFWDSELNVPHRRTASAAIVEGNQIFVFGGEGPTNTIDSIDVFDAAKGQWTTRKEMMPHARYGLGAAFDVGSFFLIGGGQRAGLSISSLNEVMVPVVPQSGQPATPSKK